MSEESGQDSAYVEVTENLLDLQKAVDAVACDSAGATATFIGR
jgi:molybdopterin synthase catalytic subunit